MTFLNSRRPRAERENQINRRTFLRGSGALIALPFLGSMLPASVRRGLRADGEVASSRLLFYYVPNGIHMPLWTPAEDGANYTLPPILSPLLAHRDELTVLTGLANRSGEDTVPGDHARGTGSFLTCERVVRSEGDAIQNGVSVDQVAAKTIGASNPFPSLQLGVSGGASVGDCDSGYSCAYSRNISWSTPTTPVAKITSPVAAFDRLFPDYDTQLSEAQKEKRRLYRTSILDDALAESQRLRGQLGRSDQLKLDEYLTGLREVERRVQGNTTQNECVVDGKPSVAPDFGEHLRQMADIMVLAMQCDLTRVVSFMLGNAASNQTYEFLGISGAHHEISHHQGRESNFESLTTIDTWEVAQFAYLLERMKTVQEGDKTLLDNSLVFFSSEISDGDSHLHTDLPVLLAGSGGGRLRTGEHVRFAQERPIADLFLTMLQTAGVETDSFGADSTGVLSNLIA